MSRIFNFLIFLTIRLAIGFGGIVFIMRGVEMTMDNQWLLGPICILFIGIPMALSLSYVFSSTWMMSKNV